MTYLLIYILLGIIYIEFTRTEEESLFIDLISVLLWPLILVLSHIWK